jgi:hypothetical protein
MKRADGIAVIVDAAIALVLAFALILVVSACSPTVEAETAKSPQVPSPAAEAPLPAIPAGCPEATVTVSNSTELEDALTTPEPGTVIRLRDAVYKGNFTASGTGNVEQPITLCGTSESILDGGSTEEGYVFHLQQSSYWVLQGFTVRNGQKGVMVDETTSSIIQDLTVHTVGDEAIHLRKFSTDNRKPKFGEGIYIGTAESNWCDVSNCEPDRSDRNEIVGNAISATTSESVDIKEGTSNGIVRGNTFEGSGIVEADSWVDVKGTGWTIAENNGSNSPMDGYQTHEIIDGWGTSNVFRSNTAVVNGPGFGYSLTPVRGNIVECSNQASAAEKGLSNAPCAAGQEI